MPPAQSVRAAPRRQTRKPPPRRRARQAPVKRVRWDRVGRVSLLIVLAVVIGLYVKQAVAYFSVRGQAEQEMATTLRLAKDNHRLLHQQQMLRDPAQIQRDARVLGMIRQGERPYVVTDASAR